jgi:tRNA 2-thiouridine synthesizing protein E
MPTLECEGEVLQTDDDGFLLEGSRWTPQVAESLARESGIEPLTDRHWKVIALCREDTARRRRPPTAERISELSGFALDELRRLFPGDPGETIARIAGLPRPSSELTGASPRRSAHHEP